METEHAHVPGGGQERLEAFQSERAHLLSLAFRILGSEPDAEDVVQEAWIRYDSARPAGVGNVAAWLTTVTTRLCLDRLRRRREVPREPTEEAAAKTALEPGGSAGPPGPEESAVLAHEVTAALSVVLEELTPPQRVALVLHDVFGVPFDEVARVLGTTPASAKKLASRARGRLRGRRAAAGGSADQIRGVVEAFLHAAQQGDTARLVRLLDPDVVRTADPQALADGGRQRVRGAGAVVAETAALRDTARQARLASVDGHPGIVVGDAAAPRAVLVFGVAGGRIVHYDVIADPLRLALLHIDM